jgi:predicted small lipoprotein YifL
LNRNGDRRFIRLALIGVAVASLSLAACGRKGPLDLPPGGTFGDDSRASVPADTKSIASPIGGPVQVKDDNSGVGPYGRPQAPKGENKRIFLDGLLN